LGEVRIKQAAANSKKGVVGMMGRKIPITPNTTLSQPTEINNIRRALVLNLVNADMSTSIRGHCFWGNLNDLSRLH
jgi:hypothetical protein